MKPSLASSAVLAVLFALPAIGRAQPPPVDTGTLRGNAVADQDSGWQHALSASEVNTLVNSHRLRIVDLRVDMRTGRPRFDVLVVANASERPWSWSHDLTPARTRELLESSARRPLVLAPYELTPDDVRIAVVWEPGVAGDTAAGWVVVANQTSEALDKLLAGGELIPVRVASYTGRRGERQAMVARRGALASESESYDRKETAALDITSRVAALLAVTDGTHGLYLKEGGGPVLAQQNATVVFEPASTLKAAAGYHVFEQLETGLWGVNDPVNIYQPPAQGSCPTNIDIGDEALWRALREMLWHSDNARTRVIVDTFGQGNINATMSVIGMASSRINHVFGCGGPPENQLTLVDAATLYEDTANGTLVDPGNVDAFHSYFPGKGQFTVDGYDWTALWDTDIPNMILDESPPGMTAAQRQEYRSRMDLAYKAGNYKICTNWNCSTYRDHVSIAGWAAVPFCTGAVVELRQFVFGLFIYNSTSDLTSAQAFGSAKGELLREQIRDGLASCYGVKAISVTPNGGSGATQAFTLQYSDSLGATDLSSARVRFGTASLSTGTCTVHYNATTSQVRIQDDLGTWGPWTTFGFGTLANSQCTLRLGSSSAAVNDDTLTVVLDLSFTSTFTGPKTIYMLAASGTTGSSTGWIERGAWTIPDTEVQAVSVAPNSGSGVSQLFAFAYTDSFGVAADLSVAQVRFGTSSTSVGSCTVHYNAMTGLLRIQDDAGTWGPWTPLGGGTLANSQCTVDLAQSTATANNTTLQLTLRVAFTAAFTGSKIVFMRATSAGGATTGWKANGTWIVPLAQVEAIAVVPNTGSGVTQLFTLTYADSLGVTTDLMTARVRLGATNAAAGSCTIDYNAMTALVRLQDDAGFWGAWTPLGSGTLANSQCVLDLPQSSASSSGTTLTLSLHLAFTAAFVGPKTIFMRAMSASGPSTGLLARGTWTVGATVEAISVTPNTGIGMSQTFTLEYADSLGVAADLMVARVRIGATTGAPGSCTIDYNAMTALVRLQDNDGIWGSWMPFGNGTLENSQCTLDLAQSTAVASGVNLTLTLRLAFSTSFIGTKNIYMRANSQFGSTTGLVWRGAWTVAPAAQLDAGR